MAPTWSARMIGSEEHPQAPLLRFEFEPDTGHGELVSASWRVSAQGVVEASVNGVPASADVLTPGWSSYEWRLRYRSYDVAALVREAGPAVVLGLALGSG